MTVTIKEVAREAGVSVATVSRVLNNSSPVNPATRQRVEDTVRSLRYVPHGGARSLITRRASTFGVLLPDLYGEFFSEIIRGLDESARAAGYHLLVSSSHSDRREMEAAMRSMRGRVDGLVIMSPDLDGQVIETSLPEGLPVVLLNSVTSDGAFDSVSVDNVGGAKAAVHHLLSHGHQRVAIISGPANNSDARERLRGYRQALEEAGIEPLSRWELRGNFTEDSGYEAARAMIALGERPTAVFAANDAMAIGAMSAFRERGLEVPDDLAIAGFDDIPIAHYVTPPLTSVHVPIVELGARAVTILTGILKGTVTAFSRRDVVETTLVIRNTCGPHDLPARRDAHHTPRRFSFSTPIEVVAARTAAKTSSLTKVKSINSNRRSA